MENQLQKEIWKDIIGFEGKYQISNTGKVLSLNYNKTKKPKILKSIPLPKGARGVRLSLNTNKPIPISELLNQHFYKSEIIYNDNYIYISNQNYRKSKPKKVFCSTTKKIFPSPYLTASYYKIKIKNLYYHLQHSNTAKAIKANNKYLKFRYI